jgi:opacity protein-like surface antigen
MKTLLTAIVFALVAITSAYADAPCMVKSPDGTLNVRDLTSNGPGKVTDVLPNGYVVTVRDFYLLKGKSWARVLDGKTKSRVVGWVFRDYLNCDIDADAVSQSVVVAARTEVYPYICKTTDERGNTQMYTARLDLGRGTITWRGKVFGKLKELDGCKAAYRGTASDGSIAELCTATQGVADLAVNGTDFECNIIHN